MRSMMAEEMAGAGGMFKNQINSMMRAEDMHRLLCYREQQPHDLMLSISFDGCIS